MSTQKYYKINKLNGGKLHRQKDEHKLAAAVQSNAGLAQNYIYMMPRRISIRDTDETWSAEPSPSAE